MIRRLLSYCSVRKAERRAPVPLTPPLGALGARAAEGALEPARATWGSLRESEPMSESGSWDLGSRRTEVAGAAHPRGQRTWVRGPRKCGPARLFKAQSSRRQCAAGAHRGWAAGLGAPFLSKDPCPTPTSIKPLGETAAWLPVGHEPMRVPEPQVPWGHAWLFVPMSFGVICYTSKGSEYRE